MVSAITSAVTGVIWTPIREWPVASRRPSTAVGPSIGRPSIDDRRAELAARVIDALSIRKDIAQRISQIDVRDAHDAVVLLQDDAALLHLGEDKFLERVQAYVDLAPALRKTVPDIDYVDLRFDERLYVRPSPVKR